MTTGGGDAALREEARILSEALDEALTSVDAEAKARLQHGIPTDPGQLYGFMGDLYNQSPPAWQAIASHFIPRFGSDRFDHFVKLSRPIYEAAVRARLPRLSARQLRERHPVPFRLVTECLPARLAKALVAAAAVDTSADVTIVSHDGFLTWIIVFGGDLPAKLLKDAKEDASNPPAEIVARIVVSASAGMNTQSGMQPIWINPLGVDGPDAKSDLCKFRHTRGLPIAATNSKREGMPTDDEAREIIDTIRARLHLAGVEDEKERADVYASLARRKLLYRRHKIFPLAPNERIDGLTDAARAVSGGLRGGATRLLDADQGRARALLACLAERCDDFPSVEFDSDDQKVEIWRTVLPFYDFHDLYEFVDHRGGEVRRSFFLYGHEHEDAYPALIEPWRLEPLDGRSPPLHLMNSCVGVDTRTTDLAAEYIRFFCSHLIGNDIESGSFTVVEEMDDIRFLADRRKPIDELYAKELKLMRDLIAPLLVRQTTERPLRGNAGDELSIMEPSSKAHLETLAGSPVNVSGAILTYDRRLFYSEVAVPAVRIDPRLPTYFTKGVPFQILMFTDFPLIAAPLPIRVIRYAGFGAAAYTLSANAVRAREGG